MSMDKNSNTTVSPYLFFNGRCEEALDFYQKAAGAQVLAKMYFKDAPPQPGGQGQMPPGSENKIMHASFKIGDSFLMASDGQCQGAMNFQGFSLAIAPVNEQEARRFFNALSEGGRVELLLTKTFFSPAFGMLTDRFGLAWMIHVSP